MSGTTVILTEKLRRPEPAGLARARLETRLLAGSTSRLDLVVAPPGSGKTTLLARVAAAATAAATPVAWYRVTDDDTAEATLVAHLARSLGDALGITGRADSMGGLLESLEQWSGPAALLVLDDLHEIAGSAAEQALERFIQLRPQSLRVLVGSRRQPEMNIPRCGFPVCCTRSRATICASGPGRWRSSSSGYSANRSPRSRPRR